MERLRCPSLRNVNALKQSVAGNVKTPGNTRPGKTVRCTKYENHCTECREAAQAAGEKQQRRQDPSACVLRGAGWNSTASLCTFTFPLPSFKPLLPKLHHLKCVCVHMSSISRHTWLNTFPCYLLPIKQHIFRVYLRRTEDLCYQLPTSAPLRPERLRAASFTGGCSWATLAAQFSTY